MHLVLGLRCNLRLAADATAAVDAEMATQRAILDSCRGAIGAVDAANARFWILVEASHAYIQDSCRGVTTTTVKKKLIWNLNDRHVYVIK